MNGFIKAYKEFQDEEGFCKVVDCRRSIEHKDSLNMPMNICNVDNIDAKDFALDDAYQKWKNSSTKLKKSMDELFKMLDQA